MARAWQRDVTDRGYPAVAPGPAPAPGAVDTVTAQVARRWRYIRSRSPGETRRGPSTATVTGMKAVPRPAGGARWPLRPRSRWPAPVAAVLSGPSSGMAGAQPDATVTDPAALVHPLDGTGTGPVNPGTVGEFPGADLPFGMIQWSPDTSPNAVQSGGGYAYSDSHLSGFSLTHLSGTGCPSYQDVPILPTVGAVGSPPDGQSPFSHTQEHASPGRYQVELGGPAPIGVSLAVTTRTGISSFDFPRGTQSNVLFKVAGSVNPVSAASVHVRRARRGGGTGHQRAVLRDRHQLHAALRGRLRPTLLLTGHLGRLGHHRRDRRRARARRAAPTSPSTRAPSAARAHEGRHLLRQHRRRRAEPPPEDPGWSVQHVAAQATAAWNALLGRIAAGGGTPAQQHTFYTALYHSLLFPNVVSDDNGEYAGSDGKVHTADGRQEYANFSEWDIYRSEVQLESLAGSARRRRHGPVAGRRRRTGRLAAQMGHRGRGRVPDERRLGRPHHRRRLRHGRPQFRRRGGAPLHGQGRHPERDRPRPRDRAPVPQPVPDPALRQRRLARPDLHRLLHRRLGHARVRHRRLRHRPDRRGPARPLPRRHHEQRASNWEYEFNPATGYVQARGTDGSFPPGAGLRDVATRAGRPDGLRGGQRRAVHVVGAPGPRGPGLAHGR